MPEQRRQILAIFGTTGTGKTTMAVQVIKRLHRVLILDPNLDDLVRMYPGQLVDDVSDMLDVVQDVRAFRLKTDRIDQLDELASLAFLLGHVTVVLDEAQTYLIPTVNLKTEWPGVRDIIYRGRHNLVSLIIAAQRATDVHIAARSQWTRLVSFNQSEPDDVRWIEQQMGQKLPLATLPERTYYAIDRGGKAVLGSLDNRE